MGYWGLCGRHEKPTLNEMERSHRQKEKTNKLNGRNQKKLLTRVEGEGQEKQVATLPDSINSPATGWLSARIRRWSCSVIKSRSSSHSNTHTLTHAQRVDN